MKKIFAIVLIALLGLSVAACGNAGNRSFLMQGDNIADLQPAQMMDEIADIVGVPADNIFASDFNVFDLWLSGNFDWPHSNTITMMFERETRRGTHMYTAQLQVWPRQSEFFVTQPWRQYPDFPTQPLHRLQDILTAIASIPQEHIHGLFADAPDLYQIKIIPNGIAGDDHPHVFYNQFGVVNELSGRHILFALAPMYRVETNGERYFHVEAGDDVDTDAAPEHHYQGTGDDTIFLFFDLG